MKNLGEHLFICSAYQASATQRVNEVANKLFDADLHLQDIPHAHLIGVWKGNREESIAIAWRHWPKLRLALQNLKQESVLERDNGSCYLVSVPETYGHSTVYIGQWQEIAESEAEQLDGYTFDPATGRYYVAQKKG